MVFPEVEAPEFLDNWHMKVVRLSVLRTGRFTLRKDYIYICVCVCVSDILIHIRKGVIY